MIPKLIFAFFLFPVLMLFPGVTNAQNIPPVAEITEPGNGKSFTQGTTVTIEASATDVDGSISSFKLIDGDDNIVFTTIDSNLEVPLVDLPLGEYTYKAIATDNEGQNSDADIVTFSIVPAVQYNPEVFINSPESGESFDEGVFITVEMSAYDDGFVEKVELYTDAGEFLGVDFAAPWQITLQSVAPGDHQIYAVAFDNENLTGSSELVDITIIEIPNSLPTSQILFPAQNSIFHAGDNILFQIDAFDADGNINFVQLEDENGMLLGQADELPYEFNITILTPGTYVFYVSAIDNLGDQSTPEAITIIVGEQIENMPPTVVILSPEQGDSFMENDTIYFEVDAADLDGTVSKVELIDVNGNIYQTLNEAPWVFAIDEYPLGNTTFYAIATDNDGSISQSEPVLIKVTEWPNEQPSISLIINNNSNTLKVNDMLYLEAITEDGDGQIEHVDFHIGNMVVTDSVAPYTVDWLAEEPGSFTVFAVVKDDSGEMVSSDSTQIIISEITATSNIETIKASVFPNPTAGFFNIVFDNPSAISKMQILTTTGKVLLEKTIKNQYLISTDLSAYGKGLYHILIFDANQQVIKSLRILVE